MGIFEVTESHETGACAVVVHGKERALCAYLGASSKYSSAHLNENIEKVHAASMVYATGFFITSNAAALRQVASLCAEKDKPFGFNLSACFVIQFYLADVQFAIEHADFVFCNEDECDEYGKAIGIEAGKREEIAKAIVALPKKNQLRQRSVIITQGSRPVIIASQDEAGALKTELVELDKIDKSTIVDTNGAGDSFVGAFFAALVQGKSVVEAVQAGNRLAGVVITKNGCTFE